MDRPVLHPLALALAAHQRLQEFAAALPARARVSEPALPLLLAALHEHLGRALVCLLPEDADARDAAEAAGWFLGPEQVAFLPGRGVGWDSGLEPPPHLVGERVRALDALAAGGYERVERVEERGQFAVRGGILDVFPSTGREPLRVELFGDEVEQVRAFSVFTQRALRAVERALVYPAAERRADGSEPSLRDADESPCAPSDLAAGLGRP